MNNVVNAALPIFGLILLGYVAGKRSFLGPDAINVLNRFVVYMALPALLFLAMARITWSELTNWPFLAAFGGGAFATFLVAMAIEYRQSREWKAVGIRSLSAGYANTGFMGAPLCLLVFGRESLPAVAIATAITVCPMMSLGVLVVGFDQSSNRGLGRTLGQVGRSVVQNPLLIGPTLGLAWAASGIALPGPLQQFTSLLGGAASPCALITIGLFLAVNHGEGDSALAMRVVGYKLFLQPAITAAIVFALFDARTTWSDSAILLSALPIGTGPFLLARLSGREAGLASRAIFLSTVGSLLTVSALIMWFERN